MGVIVARVTCSFSEQRALPEGARDCHQAARGAGGPSTGRRAPDLPLPRTRPWRRAPGATGLWPKAEPSATAVSAPVRFLTLPQRPFCSLGRSFKECTIWTRAASLSPAATLVSVLCSRRYTGSTGEAVEASKRRRPSGAQALGGTHPLGRPSSTTSPGTACPSTQLCPATPPAVASGLRGSCCPPATAGPPLPTSHSPAGSQEATSGLSLSLPGGGQAPPPARTLATARGPQELCQPGPQTTDLAALGDPCSCSSHV